jgi:DNA-binding NarL/FixJ family response regulator
LLYSFSLNLLIQKALVPNPDGPEARMPVRLLVVDDNEIVRMGVRVLLSAQTQWEICGEAENGADAIMKVQELAPDVVILDLTMPVLSGYDTATRIRKIAPGTRIVFFSIHDVPTSARLVGADAFVSKSSAAHQLTQAISTVLASEAKQSPLAKNSLNPEIQGDA